MADVRITALPAAQAITGTELVPVVQNGLTVQTTVSAITSSPSLTQTFLTVGLQTTLSNSRYFSTGVGLGITDGGAQGSYTIAFNGTAASLETAGTGIIVKTAANTITARSFAVSGSGLSLSNGSGISGDPTLSLSGLPLALANAAGTGLLAINGSALTPLTLTGASNEISVTNGNGAGGNPIIGIVSNPVLPGTAAVQVPSGTTAQRAGAVGAFRLNLDTGLFEGYNGSWNSFAAGSGVTSIATGTGLTGGPITSTGTISIDSTVVTLTDTQTLTNKTISGANNTLSNIANASLTNSAITINGTSVSLGGSTTVTAAAPFALTMGTGLSGTSYNGSAAVTVAIANTAVTAAAYGSASSVATFTVNAQGQLTLAATTAIAINGNQITSGTVGVGYGGTGLASYTIGDLLYASGTTTLSKLTLGTTNYVLTAGASAPQYVAQSTLSVGSATTATTATNLASGAAGSVPYQTGAGATSMLALGTNGYVLTAGASAPTYVAQSTLSVGTATDATNTAITDDTSTATAVYPTWVTANTGNLPQKVTSTKLSFVPSTGALTATGGISGGTF
jgi:hypothetical protein